MSKSENLSNSENAPNSENECIIDGELEDQINILISKASIEENVKLYGPIYNRMVSEYALEFESRMLKEKPPEDIRGLEAVIKYLIANENRYPRGNCALIYGIAKTESKLQGHAGSSGSRRAAYTATKSMLEKGGLLKDLVGTTENVLEAAKAFAAKAGAAFASRGLSVSKAEKVQRIHYFGVEGKNQVSILYSDCPYKDTCRALLNEGISRLIGGLQCVNLILANACTEIITKKRFDYVLDEFDKPDCRGRIFEA
ncbi:MAG: hypothetical protein WED07_13900 [Candidatus Freyarchaeum deiterrae]